MEPIYGIWLYGIGWLKAGSDFFGTVNHEQAREIARHITGASVRFIDSSPEVNQVLQDKYIEKEMRSLCHYFKRLLERKPNK